MQDLASEFSKIFRGWHPGPSQQEGATPSRTQHPGRARGASKRSGVGTQTLASPLNFSAVVAPLRPYNAGYYALMRDGSQQRLVWTYKCAQKF